MIGVLKPAMKMDLKNMVNLSFFIPFLKNRPWLFIKVFLGGLQDRFSDL